MKKLIWTILVLLSFSVAGSAQSSDEHIVGHVKDKATKEFVPYINISVKGTTIGTTTDATGHYFIKNLPSGKYTLVASGMGYKPVEKKIDLTQVSSLDVDFEIEEDAIMIESVVVSANKNVTNRREAPSIVNIISPRIFDRTNSVCLSQALNFQPGLRVETDCQNCGYQQVRINGLDGPYSQVLIDSRPVFSALQSVYGIEQIPANMIERVEVVRGGGSAIFGSNAIAGTINIITKDPSTNSATIENNTALTDGKKQDITTSFNASIVSDDNKMGVVVFGSTRKRAPFDDNGDGFSEITKLNGKNLGFKGYYKTSNYSKLTAEYHNLYEFRRGGNDFSLPPHEADIAEQAQHYINTGSLNYDILSKNEKHHINIYSSGQIINRSNYAGAQQDLDAYGKTRDRTLVSGAQYTWNMDKLLFMPAELTMGLEYNFDKLHDEILGYNRIIDQSVNTKSAYLQNEWKNEKYSVLVGARLDKHNLIDNPILSPRVNLRYNPDKVFSFRASYSGGFRAPQVYDEDLHGSAIGGETAFVQNDPDLKTEKSQSYSGSIDISKTFGSLAAEFLAEGFYTNLKNVFYLQEAGTDSEGNLILERENGSGATVKGVNLEGKVVPSQKLQFQFGMTFQRSRYKEAQQWSDDSDLPLQKKIARSPDKYGYLTAYYQPDKHLGISLTGNYTGSMLVQHFAGYIDKDTEKSTRDFYDMGIKFSYNFKLDGNATLQLNAGVKNIFNSYQDDFDKGVDRDAGYIYGPSLPRTPEFGVKIIL